MDTDKRLAVSIPEAAQLLGISKPHAYRQAAAGHIPTIRLGSRRLVSLAALRNLLDPTDDQGPQTLAALTPRTPS